VTRLDRQRRPHVAVAKALPGSRVEPIQYCFLARGRRMRRREFLGSAVAVVAYPVIASAQQTGLPVVGVLSSQSAGKSSASRVAGFLQGLSEMQFEPERNVTIEYRWAEGHYERLKELAEDLVHHQVAVIAATTQDAALAAKAATTTIPIAFNIGGDPVKTGLVRAMNQPGGNATGLSMFTNQLEAKRLGLLREMLPKSLIAGVLINPDNASAEIELSEVQKAAQSLGFQVEVRRVARMNDLEPAFEGLSKAGVQALMAGADPFLANQRELLVAFAAKYRLPAMWEWPDFVEAGGLMSYGTDIVDNYRQLGVYIGRILKGELPAQMPVVQPVNFILAINLKTARTLNLEVPPTLLARADQVIE
jgi:putative tryptophan/tyrosine transport system substrate-binding protein